MIHSGRNSEYEVFDNDVTDDARLFFHFLAYFNLPHDIWYQDFILIWRKVRIEIHVKRQYGKLPCNFQKET